MRTVFTTPTTVGIRSDRGTILEVKASGNDQKVMERKFKKLVEHLNKLTK